MKDNEVFFIKLIMAVLVLVIIGCVVAHFYALIKYGNTPVSDMPAWVWWILQNGGW